MQVRYGYRRLYILLRREGWKVNHKRTYRIYRDEGLSIRSKLPKRKRAWHYRQGRPTIGGHNEVWAMDFVSDRIFDGRPFRILTVVGLPHARGALTHAESQLPRLPSDRGSRCLGPAEGAAQEPAGRQWAGVCRSHARPMGLPEWGRDRLLPTGQADRQRLHRVVQPSSTGKVPERLVVPVAGRCPRAHRGMEVPLQRRSTPHGSGRLDAPSLRRPSCHSPRTCISRGPQSGSTPRPTMH